MYLKNIPGQIKAHSLYCHWVAPLLAVRQAGSHRSARAIDGTLSRASLLVPFLIMVTMFGLDNPVSLAICNCDFFGFSSSTRRSTYFASRVVSKGLAGIFPYCDDTQHLLHIFVIAMRLMAILAGDTLSATQFFPFPADRLPTCGLTP